MQRSGRRPYGRTVSYEQFVRKSCRVFDHAPEGKEIGERILNICQGKRRAAEYALEFLTLAAESEWNEPALKAVFRRGLNESVREEMACRDDEATLDSLIDLAICLDNLLCDRNYYQPPFQPRRERSPPP